MDSQLRGDFDANSAWKAAETAMACVERNSIQRPVMSQVVSELRECLEMETARGRAWTTNGDHNSSSSSSALFDIESSVSHPSAR